MHPSANVERNAYITAEVAKGERSLADIGAEFGVTFQCVQQIARRAGVIRGRRVPVPRYYECPCGDSLLISKGRVTSKTVHRMGTRHREWLFWQNVAVRSPNECWEWRGSRYPTGYGRVRPTQYAHRLAWGYTHGPIPAGLHVLHHCDNPPCCNPAHLWVGTPADNMRDRDLKGRGRNGPNAPGTFIGLAARRAARRRAP